VGEKFSIGQALRQRREERSLTPEQAAYQCKVPLRLLQILEADDYHLVPDPAYLTRLLHEYARLLAMDQPALEAEFREAIRRPPGASLAAVGPPAPPPAIPWKQLLWTAAAILVVTPLVFIALSLASKRAAEHPAPAPVVERPIEEQTPTEEPASAEGNGTALADRLLGWHSEIPEAGVTGPNQESPEPPPAAAEPVGPAQGAPAASAPAGDSRPGRFLLTARAVELTWIAVRADEGKDRQILLQKGQSAIFAAEAGFEITLGNAGGVDLSLNGEPIPPLGKSGQVVRKVAIPPVRRDQGILRAAPGTAPAQVAPRGPER
jgi:cytoskeleton protein RodZ